MTKKEVNDLIRSDLFRYIGYVSTTAIIINIVTNPGFKYMYFLRKCQYFSHNMLFVIPYYFCKFMLRKYRYKYGFDIPEETTIGKGFYIGHFGGITINPSVKMGSNVNIAKGVTIGQSNRGRKKGVPIIGDSVWIGTNAVVVGEISVGNNVLIAPGAYVNFDVPDNSMVIGNPGKVVPSEKAVDGYINNLC